MHCFFCIVILLNVASHNTSLCAESRMLACILMQLCKLNNFHPNSRDAERFLSYKLLNLLNKKPYKAEKKQKWL